MHTEPRWELLHLHIVVAGGQHIHNAIPAIHADLLRYPRFGKAFHEHWLIRVHLHGCRGCVKTGNRQNLQLTGCYLRIYRADPFDHGNLVSLFPTTPKC